MSLTWMPDPAPSSEIGGYSGGVKFFIIHPRLRSGSYMMTSPIIGRPHDRAAIYSERNTVEELKAIAEKEFKDWLRRAQLVEAPCH